MSGRLIPLTEAVVAVYDLASAGQMSLQPGTRIGSYEIVALLGAGGTGKVYRARDTSLKRDVAIKILPDAFAQSRAAGDAQPSGAF